MPWEPRESGVGRPGHAPNRPGAGPPADGGLTRRGALSLVAGLAGVVVAGCTDASSGRDDTAASTSAAPPSGQLEPSGPSAPGGSSGPSAPVAAPSTTTAASPAVALVPSGTPTVVAGGLAAPWSVVFVEGTALVSERNSARILEVLADGTTRVVGVVAGVVRGGTGGSNSEGGLLGLAADGAGVLYAYSTGSDGNRIQAMELTGGPGSFRLGEPSTLVGKLGAATFHNGGRIAFGPDGMLYAGVGDAGRPADAQSLGSLNGKILRMTPDGSVPADNPFPGSLVYSYGHRNVQGLAWGPDHVMYATEFGQNTWDELNVIRPGANYGWPTVEGRAGRSGMVDPVQQWSPDSASPSGLAAIGGTLFVANLKGQRLRTVPTAEPASSTEFYRGTYGRLRAVVAAPDGSLWFSTSNTDGRGSPHAGDDRLMRVALAPA